MFILSGVLCLLSLRIVLVFAEPTLPHQRWGEGEKTAPLIKLVISRTPAPYVFKHQRPEIFDSWKRKERFFLEYLVQSNKQDCSWKHKE